MSPIKKITRQTLRHANQIFPIFSVKSSHFARAFYGDDEGHGVALGKAEIYGLCDSKVAERKRAIFAMKEGIRKIQRFSQ